MWDYEALKELLRFTGQSVVAGLFLVIGYLVIQSFRARIWAKSKIALDQVEVDSGANREWKRFAGFLKKQMEDLQTRCRELDRSLDAIKRKHEQDMREVRIEEQKCQRQYNALRMRCDRYEEAMRQANIPFEEFDSDEFLPEGDSK